MSLISGKCSTDVVCCAEVLLLFGVATPGILMGSRTPLLLGVLPRVLQDALKEEIALCIE